MSNYKKTIGIEVHCELKTNNKIFSPALSNYGSMANTNINIIDLGYPGSLPVLNVDVVKMALKACKVLNLNVTREMHFDRKNYFYPDLPKGFQITQQATPIGREGYVEITKSDGTKKKIYIEEMHIEEDTCKSVHGEKSSLLDFNRAGVPLIEIVTKPCMESSEEAVLYLEKLRELLLYAEVSDCKIEEGSMRCDTNVSISKTEELGTKVETKNIGSITNVGVAIEYEAKRQEEILEAGGSIVPETRRFDDKTLTTVSMRVKEVGNDYRYFPEPDIPTLKLTDEFINDSTSDLSRSPDERRETYKNAGINPINIEKIIANKNISDYLERFLDINLVIASNLLLGDIASYLNKHDGDINSTHLTDTKFKDLVSRIDKKEISNHIFKEILDELMENDKTIDEILESKGLNLVSDQSEIENTIKEILAKYSDLVNQYKNGNERASKAIMGMIMKETHGSLSPQIANEVMMKLLNE